MICNLLWVCKAKSWDPIRNLYRANIGLQVAASLTQAAVADVTYETVNVQGDATDPTVAAYIEQQYGIRHDFIGWVVLILFAYIAVFLGVAAVSLKKLNFQQK